MSLNYTLCCERKTGGSWSWIGEVARISRNDDVLLELFGIRPGPQTLFKMRLRSTGGPPDSGRPPALDETSLRDIYGVAPFDEWYFGWLPFEELCVDTWCGLQLQVAGKAPQKHSLLFGDGQQPFPKGPLIRSGIPDRDLLQIERPLQLKDAADRIDWQTGKSRHELDRMHPDSWVWVTWRLSVHEMVAQIATDLFLRLLATSNHEELRIVCIYS